MTSWAVPIVFPPNVQYVEYFRVAATRRGRTAAACGAWMASLQAGHASRQAVLRRQPGETTKPFSAPRLFLPGLLAAALVLRVSWWVGYVRAIENEGVEYVRLAANLFHGNGYVSIFGGTHTLFPPLYPC